MRRNSIIILTMFLAFGFSLQAQNLLDLSDWTIGTGSAGVLSQNGSTSENTREWGTGPLGNRVILWKASPDALSNADGGWATDQFAIDHTKMYRFSVWIKKTNSNAGTTYFGCNAYPSPVTSLTGTGNTNPYFWNGDLPELDKWYLIVGYIHGSGDNSTTNYGRIYDGETGKEVLSITDFKFQTTATTARHRSYLYYDTNTSDRQYFYAPRMEVVNGNEPSIADLLGLPLASGFGLQAQNLLDLSDWTIGTGSAGVLSQNGSTSENTREWGTGPLGNRVILWKASPDALSNADGGWNSPYLLIDHTKMYRFSVWIKKTNSNAGTTYFGPRVTGGDNELIFATSTSKTSNPYFFSSDLPSLDKWYLLVSYVQGSGDPNSTYLGKMYDGETGNVVDTLKSFKFQTTATQLRHRSYLYYDTNTSDRQYFYAPRMEVVNGNEPSIAELLGLMSSQPEELRVATDDLPDGYKLSVGGGAIAEKIKVSLVGQWPDYVFNEGYRLPQLDSLQKFVKAYRHLPGIPSATEISHNGQDLGLIQQKLLEKIEELTLYVLEQQKQINHLFQLNEELKKRTNKEN